MRSALAGLAILAVGCAHAPQGHSGPSQSHWRELNSRHFFCGPIWRRRCARRARRLRGPMRHLPGAWRSPTIRRASGSTSCSSRTMSSFRKLAPLGAAATSCRSSRTTPIRRRRSPCTGHADRRHFVEATQRRFRHELTHRFLDHRAALFAPVAGGGMAAYFWTLKMQFNEAVVGTLPNTRDPAYRHSSHHVARAGDGRGAPRLPPATDGARPPERRLRHVPSAGDEIRLLRRLLGLRAHDAQRAIRLLRLRALRRPPGERHGQRRRLARCFRRRVAGAHRAALPPVHQARPDGRAFPDVPVPTPTEPEQVRRMPPTRCTSCWRAFGRGTRARTSSLPAASSPRRAAWPVPRPSAEMQFWSASTTCAGAA